MPIWGWLLAAFALMFLYAFESVLTNNFRWFSHVLYRPIGEWTFSDFGPLIGAYVAMRIVQAIITSFREQERKEAEAKARAESDPQGK